MDWAKLIAGPLMEKLIDLQSTIERLESGEDAAKVCRYLREDLQALRLLAAKVPESATLQADSSIGWYFYNGRKFERREPAESATPAPELSDKHGWVYDPDAKLAEIRAGMATPAESAKGPAPTGRREGEK